MRQFSYDTLPASLLSPATFKVIAAIHEYKGKQELYLTAHADALSSLCEHAKTRSTDASNRIEGIFTSEGRLAEIMAEKTMPRNRNEQEIAGYRDVLALIHESHDSIDVTPSVILQLHSMLTRHSGHAFGGRWKDSDNVIVERAADGTERVRLRPLPAVAVPDAMSQLCDAYNRAVAADVYDPLILASLFAFDFTCIHPFVDGNGRMSRLLTLLLLYRSGYVVGKYVSIEDEINRTKATYYEALRASSAGWTEGENDCAPFVEYLLGVILAAYRDFEQRVDGIVGAKKTKAERIEAVFDRKLGTVSKRDITNECPDISVTTIERTLHDLLAQGKIEKVGAARATAYRKIS